MRPKRHQRKAPAVPARDEDNIQHTVCEALDLAHVLYCAVPNGGKRRRTEAAIMKGLGVKAGVPDLLILQGLPRKPDARGGALEIKTRTGRVSTQQRAWRALLREAGWEAEIGRGLDECLAVLRGWGVIG